MLHVSAGKERRRRQVESKVGNTKLETRFHSHNVSKSAVYGRILLIHISPKPPQILLSCGPMLFQVWALLKFYCQYSNS